MKSCQESEWLKVKAGNWNVFDDGELYLTEKCSSQSICFSCGLLHGYRCYFNTFCWKFLPRQPIIEACPELVLFGSLLFCNISSLSLFSWATGRQAFAAGDCASSKWSKTLARSSARDQLLFLNHIFFVNMLPLNLLSPFCVNCTFLSPLLWRLIIQLCWWRVIALVTYFPLHVLITAYVIACTL